ncbi:hypothetical protein [Aliarcobacter butzleri]|uniref:hypothetical protein n=1 Tax=Aliarcobacter butzleri TaxID=28197 RepID=UPI001269BD04|nr:hypothetical protein [Aliarcobacter butzleri]
MTNEQYKELKKQFTKDINIFRDTAVKFFNKNRKEFNKEWLGKVAEHELFNEINKWENGVNVADEKLKEAYWALCSYTNYTYPQYFELEKYNSMLSNLEIIKDTKIYPYIKELIDIQYPKAIELLAREKELEEMANYMGKKNALERTILSFKNEENKQIFTKFIKSLENWKETYIDYSDKSLVINGKNCGEKAFCGVIIGRGNKIHNMLIKVSFDSVKKKHYIGCYNDTQWINSDLIIIDIIDNIPDEVKAYFK